MSLRFPPTLQSITGASGRVDANWERWFGDLVRAVNSAATTPETPVDPGDPVSFVVSGSGSVRAEGSIAGGEFVVGLVGDVTTPEATHYYGTNEAGDRSWHSLQAHTMSRLSLRF